MTSGDTDQNWTVRARFRGGKIKKLEKLKVFFLCFFSDLKREEGKERYKRAKKERIFYFLK
jgi:hypothetical protein